MLSLFPELDVPRTGRLELCPGAAVLYGAAYSVDRQLLSALDEIVTQSPFRHMTTPGGFTMSVGMTNCGALGWLSDAAGYRYGALDPITKQPWPSMPPCFLALAQEAAAEAGFPDYVPDACLINRYTVGARLSLHQDRDEQDLQAPIVSVSLGLPATFQFGGLRRKDVPVRVPLRHGDVVVWGGPARLRYHGVLPLQADQHPLTGPYRINLSFRRVRTR
ncbi:MAG: DNA oxidative demethylase AlkB [Nitrospiraceae bacterium]